MKEERRSSSDHRSQQQQQQQHHSVREKTVEQRQPTYEEDDHNINNNNVEHCKQEKAVEQLEVQIAPQVNLQERIQMFEGPRRGVKTDAELLRASSRHHNRAAGSGPSRATAKRKTPLPLVEPVKREKPARPTYAASARKVLMSSARGLMRLQGTMASLASLYVNEKFEEGAPCQVAGCPLNPDTRVRRGRRTGNRATFFIIIRELR